MILQRHDIKKALIVGDIHGCFDEFLQLINQRPDDRIVIGVGDLCDRGPKSVEVCNWFAENTALTCMGNHDNKFMRWLKGNQVKIRRGLQLTIDQVHSHADPQALKNKLYMQIAALPHMIFIDDGKCAISHAGVPTGLLGKDSDMAQSFALYGVQRAPRMDANGRPIREDWQSVYDSEPRDVHQFYGHIATDEPKCLKYSTGLDTGAVFGGKLTGMLYPEMQLIRVQSNNYFEKNDE